MAALLPGGILVVALKQLVREVGDWDLHAALAIARRTCAAPTRTRWARMADSLGSGSFLRAASTDSSCSNSWRAAATSGDKTVLVVGVSLLTSDQGGPSLVRVAYGSSESQSRDQYRRAPSNTRRFLLFRRLASLRLQRGHATQENVPATPVIMSQLEPRVTNEPVPAVNAAGTLSLDLLRPVSTSPSVRSGPVLGFSHRTRV